MQDTFQYLAGTGVRPLITQGNCARQLRNLCNATSDAQKRAALFAFQGPQGSKRANPSNLTYWREDLTTFLLARGPCVKVYLPCLHSFVQWSGRGYCICIHSFNGERPPFLWDWSPPRPFGCTVGDTIHSDQTATENEESNLAGTPCLPYLSRLATNRLMPLKIVPLAR